VLVLGPREEVLVFMVSPVKALGDVVPAEELPASRSGALLAIGEHGLANPSASTVVLEEPFSFGGVLPVFNIIT